MRVLTHRLTFNSRMRTPTIFTAKILLLKIMQILRGIEIKAVIWLWIDKLALRCTAVTILSIVPAKFTQDLLRVCGVVRETWRLIKRVRKSQRVFGNSLDVVAVSVEEIQSILSFASGLVFISPLKGELGLCEFGREGVIGLGLSGER
ncbi:hypothetical protein Tco_0599108 [Tanacetum coccineum]